MKTSHQLARELLSRPDLPVFHFDPSRAGLGDESDTSLSEPKAQVNDPTEGLTPGEIREFKDEGCYLGKFITLCGDDDPQGEAMSDSESEVRKILERANELCRSMHSIAERSGRRTYWEGFRAQLADALLEQHRIMNPRLRAA